MKASISASLTVLLGSRLVQGAKFPIKARTTTGFHAFSGSGQPKHAVFASQGGDDDFTLDNAGDTIYSTTLTLGGEEFKVQLDTGSSDLWIYPEDGKKIKTVNTTKVPAEVHYGKGAVYGKIDFAELEFGPYAVPSQAFMNIQKAEDMDGLFNSGLRGLVGLSFDASSSIDESIRGAYGASNNLGRTPLSNIFHQNTSIPNFLSVLLGREDDLDDEREGIFTVSEYIDEFASIAKEPKLPRLDVKGGLTRWNVAIEGLTVEKKAITLKSKLSKLSSVKNGQAVAMLDTGYSFPPVEHYIADAIYSSIPGAVKIEGSEPGEWIVPCDQATHVTWKIGGKDIPIHPLDLTYMSIVTVNNKEYTYCTNTFSGQDLDHTGFTDLDMILGDAFLKNVYTVFDFGDDGDKDPYMQVLSTTTFEEAIPEFKKVRAEILQLNPAELAPADLLKLFTGESSDDSSSDDSKSGKDDSTSGKDDSTSGNDDSDSGNSSKTNSILSAADSSSDDSDKFSKLLDKVGGYGPVIVGLLAGNMLMGLILAIIGLSICIRKGSKQGTSKNLNPTYVPVKFKDPEASIGTEYRNTYHD